ncbi:MAG: dCTP deaminase [Persephonella sp.]|nr:MAG: dCTP deaminase [Persephonella sp.]RUM61097.1 MAG: dCTP deaminase [Persephonella sp.]
MILSDRQIKELIDSGEILIEPLDLSQIQPSSVDLRLGDEFIIFPDNIEVIDVLDNNISKFLKKVKINENGFIINPKQFVLATTVEYIKLPDYITAFVEGRSSLGRLGLFIENAGWVDAGFEGNITLEFFNANSRPLKIYPNMRICQLVFAKMEEPAENPYRGKYFAQRGVTASRIFMDKDLD